MYRNRVHDYGNGKKVSHVDFSKGICADKWKTYEVDLNNKIALPEFVEKYDDCWHVCLVHSFFAENLIYGARPISIYFRILMPREGPLLVDRESYEIYRIGSGGRCDYLTDFSSYKKGKETELDWSNPPYVGMKR